MDQNHIKIISKSYQSYAMINNIPWVTMGHIPKTSTTRCRACTMAPKRVQGHKAHRSIDLSLTVFLGDSTEYMVVNNEHLGKNIWNYEELCGSSDFFEIHFWKISPLFRLFVGTYVMKIIGMVALQLPRDCRSICSQPATWFASWN